MTEGKGADGPVHDAWPAPETETKRRLIDRLCEDPEKLAAAEQIVERARRMNPD